MKGHCVKQQNLKVRPPYTRHAWRIVTYTATKKAVHFLTSLLHRSNCGKSLPKTRRASTLPPYTRGIGGLIGVRDGDHPDDFYSRRNNTYHTLYEAITGNSGNELELGNLGDTCYACGKGIKFGIKEQYPLLTKEQQESTIGRAWGLLEAFYKDIRSRRGDFTGIPSVDEVLMLVNGYGVFPEPEQVKGKKNKRKLKATPKQHREVEASLQASESVDEDTRSHEEGNSKRKRRQKEGSKRKSHFYIEALLYVIITYTWCTPLGRLVPGLENIEPGWKLLGIIPILLWGYRIMKL